MEIISVRYAYPERAGFFINRKNGRENDYTFLRFYNSVKILLGKETVITRPNTVIIYAPGTPQFFSSDIPLTHDWFHFTGGEDILKKFGIKTDTLYTFDNADFITDILRDIEYDFYAKKTFKEEFVNLKLSELFLRMGRVISGFDDTVVSSEVFNKLRILRSKVFFTLQKNWTVKQMADEVNFSESYFYELYRSVYGVSPKTDLINERIKAAKKMLTYSNNKINEISQSLGYNNTSHFIRQFKAFTGVSPLEYRHKKQNLK